MAGIATLAANGVAMDDAGARPAERAPILLAHGLGWDAARHWRGVVTKRRGVGGTEATDAPCTTVLCVADLDAFPATRDIFRTAAVGGAMGTSIAAALVAGSDRVASPWLAFGGVQSTAEGQAGVEDMRARADAPGPAAFAAAQAEAIFRSERAAANPDAVAEVAAQIDDRRRATEGDGRCD